MWVTITESHHTGFRSRASPLSTEIIYRHASGDELNDK